MRQQQEAGKIRMLGGGTWVERRSCGWVWQHSSGDYQIEQQREAAKLAGSIASTKNRGHVEARADWLVRGREIADRVVALVDEMALMEVSVGGVLPRSVSEHWRQARVCAQGVNWRRDVARVVVWRTCARSREAPDKSRMRKPRMYRN